MHRNFVVLQAYIRQPNAHLSEYDFISNGSLDGTLKKIKDKQLHLSWLILQKIAVVLTIFIFGAIPMLYTTGNWFCSNHFLQVNMVFIAIFFYTNEYSGFIGHSFACNN